jgi:hypothetical protein
MRRLATSVVAGALIAALAVVSPANTQVLGRKPSYTDRSLSTVPNAAAMTVRIWAPDLDQGFVPQGLTFFAGAIYVGAYKSEDPAQGRGPCRLYRIDPRSGAIWGALDLPPACGHAGGLARGAAGRLWVADTRAIFEVGLGSGDGAIGTVLRSVRLNGALKGSFATSTADALWLGTYSKEPGAKIYKFPFDKLEPGTDALSEENATAATALPKGAGRCLRRRWPIVGDTQRRRARRTGPDRPGDGRGTADIRHARRYRGYQFRSGRRPLGRGRSGFQTMAGLVHVLSRDFPPRTRQAAVMQPSAPVLPGPTTRAKVPR